MPCAPQLTWMKAWFGLNCECFERFISPKLQNMEGLDSKNVCFYFLKVDVFKKEKLRYKF